MRERKVRETEARKKIRDTKLERQKRQEQKDIESR
jgi:hypothetical protein